MMDKVGAYMKQKEGFSGVVSITKNHEVVYEQAFGWSDRERGIKNSCQTRFYAGSMISKPITAICIMQLIETGKLTLHQPIDSFFQHYKGNEITIHHLLNHTSGIVNHLMLRNEIKWGQPYTPEQILSCVEKKNMKFSPGKKASYNNTAYLMLGLIIEKVTGLPYAQYVKENVFDRAGMKNSGFIRDGLDQCALNYVKNKKGPLVDPSLLFACGEIVSTTEDIHKLDFALKSHALMKRETTRLMETPSYNGRFITVGYGWFIKNLMGHKSVSHGGSHPGGFTSHIERYLDDDVTIVVLSNDIVSHSALMIKDMGGTFLSREIASIIFGKKLYFWQKVI